MDDIAAHLRHLTQTLFLARLGLSRFWPAARKDEKEFPHKDEGSAPGPFKVILMHGSSEKLIRMRFRGSGEPIQISGDEVAYNLADGRLRRLRACGPSGRKKPESFHFRWGGRERLLVTQSGGEGLAPECRLRISFYGVNGALLFEKVAKFKQGKPAFDLVLPSQPGRGVFSVTLGGKGVFRPMRLNLDLEGGVSGALREIDKEAKMSGGEGLERRLRDLLEQHPNSPDVRLRLIKALRRTDRWAECSAEIEKGREAAQFENDPAFKTIEEDCALFLAEQGTGGQLAADAELPLALTKGAQEERGRTRRWGDYLELGLEERATAELTSLARAASTKVTRSAAAWQLCRWHFLLPGKIAAQEALRWWEIQKETGIEAPASGWVGVELLTRLERFSEASKLLRETLEKNPSANLCLAAANLAAKTGVAEERGPLQWLNAVFSRWGLATVDAAGGALSIDALRAQARAAEGGALVSIVVPVFNAEQTLPTALRSLAGQSWRDIEVVVVDDCSIDDSRKVAEWFCRSDSRFRLLSNEENRGTYFSRNRGLAAARGDFVTCHDADDWAHPERIETQVQELLARPDLVANLSRCVTATTNLDFRPRARVLNAFRVNYSSLMFRREQTLRSVGFWDEVRFGADGEFIARLRSAWGANAVRKTPTGPLAVVRQSANSLTGKAATGINTPGWTLRKLYQERFESWHRDAPAPHHVAQSPAERPFPLPFTLRSRQLVSQVRYDVLLASDFRLSGGTTSSNQQEILAQKRAGLRTGLIQLYSPLLHPGAAISPKILQLVDDDLAQFATVDQDVAAEAAVVRWPPAVANMPKTLPRITARALVMVCNQTPLRGGEGSETIYDPVACDAVATRIFGRQPVWCPIGPAVRASLEPFRHAIQLSASNWVNIVDITPQGESDARRRAAGRPPVIGRHARDFPGKWPMRREELLAVYPQSDGIEVNILGGADVAKEIIGYIPANWTVHPFDSISVRRYLGMLDVFVYFPDESMNEAFGRTILEAMAAGVPAVLPQRFESAFGDSALYCGFGEVRALVDRLMGDGALYAARVEKGRIFAGGHTFDKHLSRLANLSGPAAAA